MAVSFFDSAFCHSVIQIHVLVCSTGHTAFHRTPVRTVRDRTRLCLTSNRPGIKLPGG